jgi:Tol biopolymer transport system component
VDGGATQPIAISTSTTLSQIGVGPHTVSLSGVAANCTVQGTNPRAVTVASGATAEVSFAVTCSSTTGTIRVNITTSGSPTDPDGYTVRLDGAAPGRAMGTNESADFPGVAPGSHSVALSGVAPNCSIAGGPSKSVTVAVGATVEASFAVTCAATTGSIKVTTTTTGPNPDNNYSVTVDGGTGTAIGGNSSITLNGIAAGTRSVTLSGVATNCTVGGTNPRPVTVTAGQTVNADFVITCAAAIQGRIAFVSENPGVQDIFTVEPEGSPRSNLTDGLAGQAEAPEWSPDHSKIAFQGGDTGGDIWVVNADGSGLTNLTDTPSGIGADHAAEKGPRWSPDGSRILFTRTILLPPDGDVLETDIWVMNANGSGQTKLTETGSEQAEGGDYTWSPDGTKIAFTSARGGSPGIWVMGADGSNEHQLADGISFDPDWSPDGKRIAFLRQGAEIDVWAMNADGSNEDQLTNQPGDLKAEVSWSPDGTKIVYRFAASPGSSDIWTVNADGNGEFNVTKSGGDNTDPVWSPDSRQIAFVFGMGSSQPVVQVVNADGTGLLPNVSGRAAPSFRPDW